MNTPEVQLLLCCARRTIDAATSNRIRAIAEGGPDWTAVIQAALHHRVTESLHRAFRHCAADVVPEELLDALRQHVGRNAERARVATDELCVIVATCDGRSIPLIPYKGPTLALLLYGDVGSRASGDLDLLVRHDDLEGISEVLLSRGYVREDVQDPLLPDHLEAAYRKYDCELNFRRIGDRLLVEPHWVIAKHTYALSVDYEGLWARSTPIEFEGGQVMSLAIEDLLLVLCIHATTHSWTELRWAADVAALLEARPQIDLETALRRAEAWGCRRVNLLGLALARDLLGTVLPAGIQHMIDTDHVCRELAAETAANMFRPEYTPPGTFGFSLYRLRVRERWRDRFAYVWRTIVTPRTPHFDIVRLPPALGFLYYPIKLVHDYGLLPAWRAFRFLRPRRIADQEDRPGEVPRHSARISSTASGREETTSS